MQAFFLLMLITVSHLSLASEMTLIQGMPTSHESFPEALYIQNNTGALCSATVVGKFAIMTAAHCVDTSLVIQPAHPNPSGIQFVASCEKHANYEGLDFDIALCKSDVYLPVKPATIHPRWPKVGDKVLLTGFGCTRVDRTGGNDGVLRMGLSTISRLPFADNFFYSVDDAAVCSGDSGGAAYIPMANPDDEVHRVIGVNARGNMRDWSLMTSVFSLRILSWMRDWSKRWDAKVCGVTKDCDRFVRPPTPRPINVKRARSLGTN